MATPPEQTGKTKARKRDNKEIVRLVGFGIALVLLIAFVIGNSATVRVDFIFFHTNASLVWVILLSAALGVLVDRLVIVLGRRRKKRA
jgi:uncharacterized integral membrane protein